MESASLQAPETPDGTMPAGQRSLGLACWEGEGGAGPPPVADATEPQPRAEPLRQRVIALESLVIALLAGASEAQRAQAVAMADFISPRPGHTAHPLTLRAACRMRSLLDRSRRFRPARRRAPLHGHRTRRPAPGPRAAPAVISA